MQLSHSWINDGILGQALQWRALCSTYVAAVVHPITNSSNSGAASAQAHISIGL
jgi:hypothetical protein